MNKAQRKRVFDLSSKLEAIAEEIAALRDEEQEKYDNLPESLQASEKGEAFEEVAGSLDTISDAVAEAAVDLGQFT